MAVFFLFSTSPTELRHCIYRLIMPHTIPPRSPSKTVCENKYEQSLSIGLFLIDNQLHEEVFYVLFGKSLFLISINSGSVACVDNPLRINSKGEYVSPISKQHQTC